MSRKIAFRFNLLRGGGFYARLRAVGDNAPHIRMQGDGQIKMSFSGVFSAVAEDVDGRPMEINWLADEIQPVMILDGAEHPLGVYIPTTYSVSANVRVSVSVEAYDRAQRVLDTNSSALLYWPAGTRYLDAIEQLLSAAGINTVFATQNDAVFAEAREDWDAGTSYLSVVNDLLREINYKDLWFDADGAAVLEPAAVPEASQIRHTLSDEDPGTRVLPGVSRGADYFNAPNVFEVYVANPDKPGIMRAVSVNENPQSPLSTVSRGRSIVQVTKLDNIADQTALQAYADRLRNDSLITGETVTVSTALLPDWGVDDVVALHVSPRATKLYTPDGRVEALAEPGMDAICLSRSFDMELRTGGTMRHTLEKVVYALAEVPISEEAFRLDSSRLDRTKLTAQTA